MAGTVQGTNSRVQFTPDLLPSDVTGVTIYDPAKQTFDFHPGPIFANIVLADEINRASPKTQSALLEVMEEGRVTVDGVAAPGRRAVHGHRHPEPDRAGRHLPAARGPARPVPHEDQPRLPRPRGDRRGPRRRQDPRPHQGPRGRSSRATSSSRWPRSPTRCTSTRRSWPTSRGSPRSPGGTSSIKLGLSVRGCLAFVRCAKTWAASQGRTHVIPDDVKLISHPILCHRLLLTAEAQFANITVDQVINQILVRGRPAGRASRLSMTGAEPRAGSGAGPHPARRGRGPHDASSRPQEGASAGAGAPPGPASTPLAPPPYAGSPGSPGRRAPAPPVRAACPRCPRITVTRPKLPTFVSRAGQQATGRARRAHRGPARPPPARSGGRSRRSCAGSPRWAGASSRWAWLCWLVGRRCRLGRVGHDRRRRDGASCCAARCWPSAAPGCASTPRSTRCGSPSASRPPVGSRSPTSRGGACCPLLVELPVGITAARFTSAAAGVGQGARGAVRRPDRAPRRHRGRPRLAPSRATRSASCGARCAGPTSPSCSSTRGPSRWRASAPACCATSRVRPPRRCRCPTWPSTPCASTSRATTAATSTGAPRPRPAACWCASSSTPGAPTSPIVVDADPEKYAGGEEDAETAISVAASVGKRAHMDEQDFTIVCRDSTASRTSAPLAMDALARVELGPSDLYAMAGEGLSLAPDTSMAVLVTGSAHPVHPGAARARPVRVRGAAGGPHDRPRPAGRGQERRRHHAHEHPRASATCAPS